MSATVRPRFSRRREISTAPATLRVRVPSGAVRTFDAESVSEENGRITAFGRWRHHSGRCHRYSFATARVLEVRYASERVAA